MLIEDWVSPSENKNILSYYKTSWRRYNDIMGIPATLANENIGINPPITLSNSIKYKRKNTHI